LGDERTETGLTVTKALSGLWERQSKCFPYLRGLWLWILTCKAIQGKKGDQAAVQSENTTIPLDQCFPHQKPPRVLALNTARAINEPKAKASKSMANTSAAIANTSEIATAETAVKTEEVIILI
ncbi:hypothetical protein OS493_035979, partial [Desmophyllum pertusum]